MTKNEVLKKVSELSGVTQKQVDVVLSAFSDVVVDTLADNRDEKVSIGNLGTFKVKHVPERRGKIMMGERKGEEYVVPEHREPKIKLAKSFKEVLL